VTPYTGVLRLAGSTTVLGVPAPRRVDLVHQRSGLLVDSVYTELPACSYEFAQISNELYSLVGVDDSAQQNSVIYAHEQPVT
jgi:hypothetical protein